MKKPGTIKSLEQLGRVRLSPSFFMRDMLYSEISNFCGIPNIPDDPDLAIAAGTKLCEELLEPLQAQFGRISIRSAYRSPAINQYGNENVLGCASNENNYARHIWDRHDADGHMGAMATVVVNKFIPYFEETGDWQAMAWWIHDNLPYGSLIFYPKYAAFNIGWHEKPLRKINSFIAPKGCLTKPGMDNHEGPHDKAYARMIQKIRS
ncbi:MAG: hypothetical protein MRY59_13850 [Aquisalinus sp.]|nr:hypothetical protein [Aquisalinus sp.]